MEKIKIAIAGLGNCASSLIQGIFHYHNSEYNDVGLIHQKIGGYFVKDIEVVAAFDIDERKVGKDVSEAIFMPPNNTLKFCDVPFIGTTVMRGPTFDGIANHMFEYPPNERFVESSLEPVDVCEVLKNTKPDLLINYLPVGSENATRFYADCCIDSGVSFVNAIPVFLCSQGDYAKKFEEKKLVCVGDDIKSQLGATIVHRALTNLFRFRGVTLEKTYQLNVGGNTDFCNMLERGRLKSKKVSKTEAVQSQLDQPLPPSKIHIGPSDYIPWLCDNKICFLKMQGRVFGGAPVDIDLRLSVEDSPNSAGIMVEVIRCVKLALDKGLRGYLHEVAPYAFKHPKKQYSDDESFFLLNKFIGGEN